jgi:hypothetical protein
MTDDDVRKAMSALRWDLTPPSTVERRTVEALRAAGFIGRQPERRVRSVVAVAFASAVALLLGVWMGSATRPKPVPPLTAPKFLVLLYEDSPYQADASAKVARRNEYGAWAHTLAVAGRLTSGEELQTTVAELWPGPPAVAVGSGTLSDQPTGYFVILAPDEGAAVALASTCPHLKYGGRVVVRPVAPGGP